jgi:hypothetical protein
MDLPSTNANISDPLILSVPVKRGETEITSLQIRKPSAGQLRGLSVQRLLIGEVDDLLKVLPRVTVPPLIAAEVDALDLADFTQLAGLVMYFLLTPEQQASVAEMSKT